MEDKLAKEILKGYVRISIAPLIRHIVVDGKKCFAGIWLEKRQRFGAIGGAGELTHQGRQILVTDFGAVEFEGSDARFQVPISYKRAVKELFIYPNINRIEINPMREITEELGTAELKSQKRAILSEEDLSEIEVVYLETSLQPSQNENQQRIFYFYEMRCPSSVWEKIIDSQFIKELSAEEVATTNGGRQLGVSKDGFVIADNIY
jgi:hypothetical protein